jgi:hypothetical protein
MHTSLKVSSYVVIRERCPMRFRLSGNDIEFSFGGRYDPFDFVFNADALRQFLSVSSEALRELAALTSTDDEELSPR